MARNFGIEIIYLTGRPDNYRAQTEAWLSAHGQLSPLFMRKAGDHRTDDVVKKEIYEREIAPFYAIAFALEDRSRVVALWRSLGIPCFQVADGEF